MKVKCIHGYFIFEESRVGEVSDFVSLTGLEVVREDEHFIFADLADAPEYSIDGSTYLGAAATANSAGRPWEIMRDNGLIYNWDTGLLVQISSIVKTVRLTQSGKFYYAEGGLILPGSVTAEGQRVTDYAAWFSSDSMVFKYSEVGFD